MVRAFVFPGQGSQTVGMGQELAQVFPTARQVLEEVDDALNQHLSRLMFEGPADELTMTENAQPALMAVSMAVVRVLQADAGIDFATAAKFVAGHSLGEYSALAAAGALTLADAARLLRLRGKAMQDAVAVGEGAMVALIGLDLADAIAVAETAAEGDVCDVANDNAPGQVVLSGHARAIGRAERIAKERGARRVMPLAVSAPFHCALLTPAAEVMAEALETLPIVAPAPALIANVSAAPVTEPEQIRTLLVSQVTARVRWRESILAMVDQDVDNLVELGIGKILTNMARRISSDVSGTAVQSAADIEAFIKTV